MLKSTWAPRKCAIFAWVAVFATTVSAFAQTTVGNALGGAISPWRSAHFVLAAYAAVWIAVVLYIWHLRSTIAEIIRDIEVLKRKS
jgi:CcmD family protein